MQKLRRESSHQWARIPPNPMKTLSSQIRSLKVSPSSQNFHLKHGFTGRLPDTADQEVCHAYASSWSSHNRCGVSDCSASLRSSSQYASWMVSCLQGRLRVLIKSFFYMEALEDDEGRVLFDWNGKPKLKIPNPRVELPYTYLIALYVMHCPALMSVVQVSEDFMTCIQKFECCGYMAAMRKIIQSSVNYQLFRYFPDFPGAAYDEQFIDHPGSDGSTKLSTGVFCWLMNIQQGYLIFRQGNVYSIEPYSPVGLLDIWLWLIIYWES